MPSFTPRRNSGATLPELLVATAILIVVMVAMLEFCTTVERTWKRAAADPYADAQAAFETVTRNISSATLETYQDYADINGAFRTGTTFTADHLARRSNLDFVCGPATGLLTASHKTTAGDAVFFLTPQGISQTYAGTGLQRLMNATGYFVEFGDDDTAPWFVFGQSHSYRWRLKQVQQSSESLQIYNSINSSDWISQLVPADATCPIIAENIIALVILPEHVIAHEAKPLTSTYSYDSRDNGNKLTLHQLPPVVHVAMVAIHPDSALHLEQKNGTTAPALVPANSFQNPIQFTDDLKALDTSLDAQQIRHRTFQRDVSIAAANWSSTASQ